MSFQSYLRNNRSPGGSWPWFLAAVVLVGGTILLRALAYVTPPGQATVVFNAFGGLQRDRIRQPGVSLLLPFVERPISYEMRTRTWEFADNADTPNYLGRAVTVNSADGQAFAIEVYVALRPNPETLDDLHAELGESYRSTVIVPIVRSKFRDVAAEFESADFYQRDRRARIEDRARAAIAAEMPKAQHQEREVPLVLIESLFIDTPDFPEGLKESIERKQVASITAATAGVRAEIQAKETERVLILAQANQRAIELKGAAAAANAQLADLLFFERLQARVNAANAAGKGLPFRILRVEGDSTVFLNIDAEDAARLQRVQPQPSPPQQPQ